MPARREYLGVHNIVQPPLDGHPDEIGMDKEIGRFRQIDRYIMTVMTVQIVKFNIYNYMYINIYIYRNI